MDETDDNSIYAPGFWVLCLGIVLSAIFLLGSTLLVIAWVRAANYDGVGEGVHDLLIWGTWVALAGFAGLIPFAAWRVHAKRRRPVNQVSWLSRGV